MSNFGGANSAFEQNINKRIRDLNTHITRHTDNINEILKEAYKTPISKTSHWVEVRRKLDIEYKEMANIYTTWTKANIPQVYRQSVIDLMTKLNKSKSIATKATRDITQMLTSTRYSNITTYLTKSANVDFLSGLSAGKQELFKMTRRTQQTIVKESLVNKKIAEAIKNGDLSELSNLSNPNSLASLLDKQAEVINGKRYITVNGRHYTPKYYAEMVGRVKFHETQSFAAIDTAENYGTTLIQVSNHNTKTPLCQGYENKIYSIGGEDKRFPRLDTTPPYHPNCLHLLFPTFESSMEATNTIDQWSEFSKGQTGTPPAPKNFVPVNKRG